MRPDVVVVPTPSLDEYFRLCLAAESLQAQALFSELVVEALVGTVLPGLAGVNRSGRAAERCWPAPSLCDQLHPLTAPYPVGKA